MKDEDAQKNVEWSQFDKIENAIRSAEKKLEGAQKKNDKNVLLYMGGALELLRDAKPEQRGELARRYGVTITEFEKMMEYFKVHVVEAHL